MRDGGGRDGRGDVRDGVTRWTGGRGGRGDVRDGVT